MAKRVAAGRAFTPEQLQSNQERIAQIKAAAVPKGYGSTFVAGDLNRTSHPYAFSHDSGFHEGLRTHIAELRSRVTAHAGEHGNKEGASGLKISEAASQQVLPHLDAAEDALNNSFAAHKAGFEDGAPALHTANMSYQKSITHLIDAARGIDTHFGGKHSAAVGSDKNWDGKLLTPVQLKNLGGQYQDHLKSSALNGKLSVSKGVLTHPGHDVSVIGSELSSLGKTLLGRYKLPTDAAGTQQAKAGAANIRAQRAFRGLTDKPQVSTAVPPTLGEVQRAREAIKEGGKIVQPGQPGPFAGIGIKPNKELANAAARHYEFQNPGKSFWHSEHATDPGSIKAYALKHNVGTGSNYEAHLEKTMRLIGETKPMQQNAAAIASDSYEEPVEVKKPKSVRSAEFEQGGTK